MRLLRAAALATAALLASCANTTSTDTPPQWHLIPATEAASRDHLIVTVPLETPAELSAVARRLEADHPIKLVAEWPLGSIDVHCFVFRVTDRTDVEGLVRRLNASGTVTAAQQMQEFRPLAGLYSDEHFGLQDSLAAINAPKAHTLSTGTNVKIAVVDTGVDVTHPDLAARVAIARDFIEPGTEAPPGEHHGTAIAGVILADATNATGIVGVAPAARLMALRGCWQDRRVGRCTSFSLARAMNFAVLKEADVLNLSLAGPYDPLLAALIEGALDRGIVVVAAAGESAEMGFPGSLPGVIEAGAAPAVPAPTVDVITTAPGGGYDFATGTSIAAAHVSGVAALMLQRRPDLTPAALRSALMQNIATGGQTGPMLDACRALVSVLDDVSADRC